MKKEMKCIWSEAGCRNGTDFRHAQYMVQDDGGRAEAGFKGQTGDCVTRSIAIATGKPYKEVYDALNLMAKDERIPKGRKTRSSARTGVRRKVYEKYLESIGWQWIPTMKIGSGCRVHLRGDELPKDRIIVRVTHHITCMIDGVLHDNYDCTRQGTRCVYGYFQKKG